MTPDLNTPLPALIALRHIHRLSRGARGLAKIAHLLRVHTQEITVDSGAFSFLGDPKILLIGERQALEVFSVPDIIRFNTCQRLAIKLGMILGITHISAKILELDRHKLFTRERLQKWIPVILVFHQHCSHVSTM